MTDILMYHSYVEQLWLLSSFVTIDFAGIVRQPYGF